MQERPDIGSMIEEELNRPERSEDSDIEQAVDKALTEQDGETVEALKEAAMGERYAGDIQKAFELKAGKDKIEEIVDEYLAKGGDAGVLSAQLKFYARSYKNLDQVKAAEIDAVANALLDKTQVPAEREATVEGNVSSEAGKSFVAALESGRFASDADANKALGELLEKSLGTADEKAIKSEFNALMEKINEKFYPEEDKGKEKEKFEMGDDDIMSALGGL